MKPIITALAITALTFTGCARDSGSEAADTVYKNGKIYTVNEAQPWAEAVAIKDGKFIAVGSSAEVDAVTGPKNAVVDLDGQFVMPGLIDPHTHAFEDYHNRHFAFGVKDDSSPESILAEIKAYADPRRAIESGAVVAVGSDWQVSFLDPWRRIEFLVTRMDPGNRDWGALTPENAIPLEKAIETYTLGPAYAMNKEKEK